MLARWAVIMGAAAVLGVALGCGDGNVLSGLADEKSTQAKLEKAQIALDAGDCQTALTLFGELQAAEPTRVDRRLDLAAAYTCKAGFDITTLIDVAASLASNTITSATVFEQIANKSVTTLSTTWPQDLDAAVALLAVDPAVHPPTAFQNNPDAKFNLAIVDAIRAVLTVADILNYVSGVVDCAVAQGSSAFTNCQITAANVLSVVNGLQDASAVLTSLGVSSNVTSAINTVVTDLNNVDGNPNNAVTCADLKTYLQNQGFGFTSGQVACV